LCRRLRLDGLGLYDLQPYGPSGVIHRSDHREFRIRGRGQGRSRFRRLDQHKAIFTGYEKMLIPFRHDPATGDDLHQREGGAGFLGSVSQDPGLKSRIGFVSYEDNVGLLVHDDFGNASLALQGRLDGGPARASERAVGAGRSSFHLSVRRGTRKYHHEEC
jgi:hypothetical protein